MLSLTIFICVLIFKDSNELIILHSYQECDYCCLVIVVLSQSITLASIFLAFVSNFLFTGSIARSAKRRYLIYSEADFEVFLPAGATRCTDGGEIWHGGGEGPLLHAKFHPHRRNG